MSGLIPFSRNQNISRPKGNTFYNMLDDFFSDQWPFGSLVPAATWAAGRSLISDTFKVDVKESEKAYGVEAELPGVKKEEISLTADEGRFTISVNRDEENEDQNDGYIHRERHSTSMSRSVYLADIDSNNVSAKLEDGVLRITIPKTTPVETKKQIEIQ